VTDSVFWMGHGRLRAHEQYQSEAQCSVGDTTAFLKLDMIPLAIPPPTKLARQFSLPHSFGGSSRR
jgi:hypothetical protein